MSQLEREYAEDDGEEAVPVSAPLTGDSADWLYKLPSLPEPNSEKNLQATMGFTGTMCFIVLAVASTFGASYILRIQGRHSLAFAYEVGICLEAVVATVCWLGLLLVDPGSIPRVPRTALPIPPEIVSYIEADGSTALPKENLKDGYRSYCVRCFLWRDAPHDGEETGERRLLERCTSCMDRSGGPHHCSVCQRCVLHFDHHCGWFGRCIAGRGLSGNLGFFKVIIAMGQIGLLTSGSCAILALVRTKWGLIPAVGIVLYLVAAYGVFIVIMIIRLAKWMGLIWLCCPGRFLWRPSYKRESASSAPQVVQGIVIGVTQPPSVEV